MKENMDQLLEFLEEEDDAFLDEILENLTDEELSNFFRDNPDFMK